MTGRSDYLKSQLNSGWQTDVIGAGFVSPSGLAPSLTPLFAQTNPNLMKSFMTRAPFFGTHSIAGCIPVKQLSDCGITEDLVAVTAVDHGIDRSGERVVGETTPAPIVSAFARQRFSVLSQFRKVQLSRLLH
ncbi:MAG: hypothetical protein R2867_25765 [Caldilineaceae bacterium]